MQAAAHFSWQFGGVTGSWKPFPWAQNLVPSTKDKPDSFRFPTNLRISNLPQSQANAWVEVTPGGVTPGVRNNHHSAIDASAGRLYIYDGAHGERGRRFRLATQVECLH